MSQSQFISIISTSTQGELGTLSRSMVFCTRESVIGYTADPRTGMYKINSTDVENFIASNPASLGLNSALTGMFDQSPTYPFVYILSTSGSALTSAMLDKANRDPRAWMFLNLISQYQGGGNSGADSVTYFADLTTMGQWAVPAKEKIVVNTFSVEEIASAPIVLPAQLQLGGSISIIPNVKTIVSNSQHAEGGASYITIYDNIAAGWISYCINSAPIRSYGSLSDAHDFAFYLEDSYSAASHSVIANASLAQYNGAKDRAGSLFVYDTQMNDKVNPPITKQIESLVAEYSITDYVYVYVHNGLQQAGQTGLPTDNGGIQIVSGMVNQALINLASLGYILAKDNGQPDFSIATLTAEQVTILSPNWKTTGIWPSGVITATVKLFAADHYITLNFNF